MSNENASPTVERDLRAALKRGLRCKCPRCGEGSVFKGYLKVRPECGACGLDLTPQRADDGPAYVIILLVGHIIGFALPLFFEAFRDNPLLVACLLSAVAIALSLALLPPVKALFVAFQWAKSMHGFAVPGAGPVVTPEKRCAGDC